jgi:mannose-6-phosphate isomerase-like protein (cupin superfamily)
MVKVLTDLTAFRPEKAWQALNIAHVAGASVRLHWTDKPYEWHTNSGAEVFMVVAGVVDMHYRDDGVKKSVRLGPLDIFVADVGDAHVAHPVGDAHILVIEEQGSI